MKRWIACLFLIACAATAEDTFSLYGKFQEALKQNDYPGALKLAEQMIQLCPGHSGVQYQYARALAVNGKSAEALQVLKRISQMGGSPPVQSEPVFDSLKQNPEFKQLLQTFEQNKTPRGKSEIAFRLPEKKFIPEGIAYDPVDKMFYIGSTYLRKIVQVDSSGKTRDFKAEKQDGLWGMVGMEVDAKRRHLWANTANGAGDMTMKDAEPAAEGKTAIYKYALQTGKLLKKYEAGSKENARFFNDVAISSNGNVYISESKTGEVYKIDASADALEVLIPGGSMSYPNGIAISQDDKFLYVSHLEGVTVIDLASKKQQLLAGSEDMQLGNHDGLVYYNNSLVGIQGLTGGVDRVVRLHLQDPLHVKRVEALQVNHPLFALPTTGDIAGDEFYYIANSQLRSFDEQGKIFPDEKLNEPVILKVELKN